MQYKTLNHTGRKIVFEIIAANFGFMPQKKMYYTAMQEDIVFHVLQIKATHDNHFAPVV